MPLKMFFLCIVLCSAGVAQAETITFDIMLFGDKVGKTVVTRDVKPDGSEHYVMQTDSKAKILWINRENHTRYEVVYKNNRLISSATKEIENGEVKRWTNVTWDGVKYNVKSYKGESNFTKVPTFSIVTMFFRNGSGVSDIFYEMEGDFSKLKQIEPNSWEFKSSDGNTNVYHYVDGKIHHLEFHVSIATVKLIRVN